MNPIPSSAESPLLDPDTRVPKFLILDTCVVNNSWKGVYSQSYEKLIQRFKDFGSIPVVPRIVEVEMVKDANSPEQFDKTWTYVKDNFPVWPITDRILRGGCFLHSLYRQNPALSKYCSDPKLINDLIIGSFAADFPGKSTEVTEVSYILSEDKNAFHPPYFHLKNEYIIENSEGGDNVTTRLWFCSMRAILRAAWNNSKRLRARHEGRV